jgi:diguanylate cyclase (GGDEF)-like protein/PAS domain S-box-containing protein
MEPEMATVRVLLIDDDEDDFLIARDLLIDGLGACDVTWASSFGEGVEQLDSAEYDVAFVDFRLGAQTGLDLLALGKHHQWRTPIILLTGLDDVNVDRLATESGAVDYLVKQQLDSTTIERAVRYAIARSEMIARSAESERRFRSIVETANDAIVITDESGRITLWNPAAAVMFGYTDQELLGAPFDHSIGLVSAAASGADRSAVEAVAIRKDGTHLAIEQSSATWTSAKGNHTSHIIRNVTERAQLQQRLHEQATTDPLTGLPNRAYFRSTLESAAVAANADRRQGYAALFIDLDDFKLVNDRHGHAFGDEVLKQAATRIRAMLRASDLVARLGGDEFAVLIPGVTSFETIRELIDRLLAELGRPYEVFGERLHAGASIGVALHRDDQTATDVLQDADIAMYAAKARGKGRAKTYSPEQRDSLINRLELVNALRDTPIESGFELHYQPIVRLADRGVIGVEALVRWRHPLLGLLSGDRFIDVAEETGLIVALGEWVIAEAANQVERWRQDRIVADDFVMCINISATQLATGHLDRTLREACATAKLEPRSLCLEVNETTVLEHRATEALTLIRNEGYRVAIDDFGTGYSSLSSLINTPASVAKIDRSLIGRLPDDRRATTLVEGVIALSRALGLTPVADGIETGDQADQLLKIGCEHGQGSLFARPAPPHITMGTLGAVCATTTTGAR